MIRIITSMKKICMLLLSLLCLPAFAQLQKSVVYNFSDPTKLTPVITPSKVNGGVVNVTWHTFTNGPMSFILRHLIPLE